MAYEDGRELGLYNLVATALEEKPYFRRVLKQLPESPPTGLDQPQAFIAAGSSMLQGHTNLEEEGLPFRLAVILFVRAEKDVDLEKLRAMDKARRSINNLQKDSRFTDLGGSLVHVSSLDFGPLALAIYGLDWAILPPFGVIRLDVDINHFFQAMD